MSEVKYRRRAPHRVRQGRRPPHPPRRQGPAVLYGHGTDPRHITLPGHELMLALKTANALLDVDLDGGTELALPKDVQRDPIKGFIEHVDLLLVTQRREGHRRGRRSTSTGEAAPDGTGRPASSARCRSRPRRRTSRSRLEVRVEGWTIGDPDPRQGPRAARRASTLVTDPEALVVNVIAAPTAEELEAELAEAEAEAGIEHERRRGAGRRGRGRAEGDAEAARLAEREARPTARRSVRRTLARSSRADG